MDELIQKDENDKIFSECEKNQKIEINDEFLSESEVISKEEDGKKLLKFFK